MKEFEIAFGSLHNGKFQSQISRKKYFKIFFLPIFNTKKTLSKTISIIDGNYRKIIDLNSNKQHIEIKKKIKSETKNNIRITLSEETIVSNKNITTGFIRHKNRITKYSDIFPNWKFDFTISTHINSNIYNKQKLQNQLKQSNEFYQVEAEWIGKNNPTNTEINTIITTLNSVDIIIEIEQIIGETIKIMHSFMSQVINMNLGILAKIEGNYALTEKADGERYLIYIREDGTCWSINKAMNIECIIGLKSKFTKTLVDSEKVGNKYYLFDCLIFCGKDIRNIGFEKRYLSLKKMNNEWNIKKFIFRNILQNTEKIWKNKYNYKLDGLIFTPLNKNYIESSIKWKPSNMQTADFMIIRINNKWKLYANASINYIKKNNIKIDYNLIPILKKNMKHYPICYTTTKDWGNKWKNLSIIEFIWDGKQWKPEKLRADKTLQMINGLKNGEFIGPNSIRTIENIWNEIQNPIKPEWIFGKEKLPEIYYTGNNKGKSVSMRKFHNWIKHNLYTQFIKKNNTVLEIAGGRGGDLFKLEKVGISKLVLIDIAKDAVIEAKKRYNEMNTSFNAEFIEQNSSKLFNLNTKFDVVSIMFAFHYFWNKFDIIYNNINNHLKSGGYLLITCFDKNLVKEIDNETFKIVKKNNNKISVYAESIGERDEWLVDFDKMKDKMKGFTVVYDMKFNNLYNKWGNNMSEREKEFSFINRAIVFKKK